MNVAMRRLSLLCVVAALAAVSCSVPPAPPTATQQPTTVPTTPSATPLLTPTAVHEVPAPGGDFQDVIVYTQMTNTGPEIHAVFVSQDNPDVWAITQTSGAAVLPRWSPDLSQIAYLYYEPDAEYVDFWIVDVAGDGQTRPVTTGGVPGVETYAWSPDSRHLVYDAPEEGGDERDVYVIETSTGAVQNLTAGSPDWDGQPAFSPDGSRIAFVSDRGLVDVPALNNIWLMATDGSDQVNLTASVWEDVLPAWSPDATEIAFYRWSLGEPEQGGPSGVWAVKRDGTSERLVAELPGLVGAGYGPPAWSPDGEFIAFQYGPRDDADVYVVPSAGGEATRIGEAMGHDYALSWSPDSQFLLFCHTLQQDLMLYLAAPDGSVSGSLLGVGGNCYGDWAPTLP